MENDEVYERIRTLLIDEFEVPPEAISLSANTREDLKLDSLDHVDLVVELERFAGRRIESDELTTLKTVGDVVDLLRRYLADDSTSAVAATEVEDQSRHEPEVITQSGSDAD